MNLKYKIFLLSGFCLLYGASSSAIISRHDLNGEKNIIKDIQSEYPSIISLKSRNDCVATLIHDSYLLTVAHCTEDLLDSVKSVEIGREQYLIGEPIRHPQWNDNNDEFDIALIPLEKPVRNVLPFKLCRSPIMIGSEVTLIGRGIHGTGLKGEKDGNEGPYFRMATNRVSAISEYFIEIFFEEPTENAITDLEGIGAAGDSGGPVIYDGSEGPCISGINAFGEGPKGRASELGLYGSTDYQTKIFQYLEWIDKKINSQ